MDTQVIERLENSFNLLAPRADELVDRFYARLFGKAPGLRSLFPDDLGGQKKKLIAALVMVVKNLRSPEKLHDPLVEMGNRHVGYGAAPEHYPVVRDTLVETMGELAGDAWSANLTQDWNGALDFVAGVMLEGHKLAAV